MKKLLFMLLILVTIGACSEDKEKITPNKPPIPDPEPEPIEYVMPILSTNRFKVKNELIKFSTIVETKSRGYYKFVFTPNEAKDNMFKTLTYEFYYDSEFNFDYVVFSYKLDNTKTFKDEDIKKLKNHLINTKLSF